MDKVLKFQTNIIEAIFDKIMDELTRIEEFEYYFNNEDKIIGYYIEETLVEYRICTKYDKKKYEK